MKKKVAIGLQNFEELIQKDYYYIDKTDFIIMWIIFGQLGTDVGHLTGAALYESYILVGIFVLLAYIRHKDNIVRLVKGKENKLGHKKEEASDGKN